MFLNRGITHFIIVLHSCYIPRFLPLVPRLCAKKFIAWALPWQDVPRFLDL